MYVVIDMKILSNNRERFINQSIRSYESLPAYILT